MNQRLNSISAFQKESIIGNSKIDGIDSLALGQTEMVNGGLRVLTGSKVMDWFVCHGLATGPSVYL